MSWRPSRRLRLPPDRRTVIDGIHIYYPRYYFTPKILRRHYGWFYWQSIRPTVQSLIENKNLEAVVAYWVHPDGHGAVKRPPGLAGVPSAVIVGGSERSTDHQDPTANAVWWKSFSQLTR